MTYVHEGLGPIRRRLHWQNSLPVINAATTARTWHDKSLCEDCGHGFGALYHGQPHHDCPGPPEPMAKPTATIWADLPLAADDLAEHESRHRDVIDELRRGWLKETKTSANPASYPDTGELDAGRVTEEDWRRADEWYALATGVLRGLVASARAGVGRRGPSGVKRRMVAALYVEVGGIYSHRRDVECWTIERDARLYAGPWPVVAHPPCHLWVNFAALNFP